MALLCKSAAVASTTEAALTDLGRKADERSKRRSCDGSGKSAQPATKRLAFDHGSTLEFAAIFAVALRHNQISQIPLHHA